MKECFPLRAHNSPTNPIVCTDTWVTRSIKVEVLTGQQTHTIMPQKCRVHLVVVTITRA